MYRDDDDWRQFDWPGVTVGGVINAGIGFTAAWGSRDDAQHVVGLLEEGNLIRQIDVPESAARQGPIRSMRYGQPTEVAGAVGYPLVGVCGPTGLWFGDWEIITPAPVPTDEQGHAADYLWLVAGDEDLRLVAAYGPDRELRVLSASYPPRLLPRTNTLRVHGAYEDVRVGSHSGVVAIAGDLRIDGQPVDLSFSWAWSGFLEGGEEGRYSREWSSIVERPDAMRLTDMGDWPSDVRFAGFLDERPQVWGIEGYAANLDFPDGAWTNVLLPDSTDQEVSSMVLVGEGESVFVMGGGADPRWLPRGELTSVVLNEGFTGDLNRFYAVVNGVLHVLEISEDLRKPSWLR